MGLKLGQNITFRPSFFFFVSAAFLVAKQLTCRNTVFLGRDQVSWSRHSFLGSRQFFGRDTVFLGSRQFFGRDTVFWGRDSFWTATYFSSPTCRGHNFFILTRIWACEYSLESSLNVECNHEGM